MAKRTKSTKKTAGIALTVVGAGLALWGYQKSGGLDSQLSSVLTGAHTDEVMALFMGGAVCLVVGVYLVIKN